MSGTGQETLPEVWKWSGDPPGGPEVVERPSRRYASGWEALLEVWKFSVDRPGGPEQVERPSGRSRSGIETLPRSGRSRESLH